LRHWARFEQGTAVVGIFIRERGGKANIYPELYQRRQGVGVCLESLCLESLLRDPR
jgi:hypothetical protein